MPRAAKLRASPTSSCSSASALGDLRPRDALRPPRRLRTRHRAAHPRRSQRGGRGGAGRLLAALESEASLRRASREVHDLALHHRAQPGRGSPASAREPPAGDPELMAELPATRAPSARDRRPAAAQRTRALTSSRRPSARSALATSAASPQEIAHETGESIGTVKSRTSRALVALRDALGSTGVAMMDHRELLELATNLPMGVLEPAEEREVEAHLATGCVECERALRESAATLDALVGRCLPSHLLPSCARGCSRAWKRTSPIARRPPPPLRARRPGSRYALAASRWSRSRSAYRSPASAACSRPCAQAARQEQQLAQASERAAQQEQQLAAAEQERTQLGAQVSTLERMVAELTAPRRARSRSPAAGLTPAAAARVPRSGEPAPRPRRLRPAAAAGRAELPALGDRRRRAGERGRRRRRDGGAGARHEAASLPALDGP